jgi:hypothetical protein
MKTVEEEELRHIEHQVAVQESRTPQTLDNEQLRGFYLGIVVALIGILIVASFFLFPSYHGKNMKGIDAASGTHVINTKTNSPTERKFIAPITVNAIFKENVWVQVKSDGDYLYGVDGMNFDPSQAQQVWTAQREMIIKMGNPAGVVLNFNGKDLGQLGERGKIKTVKLTPHGLEAL